MRNKLEVIAYTDGSCFHKTRKGGYGVYIIYLNGQKLVNEIFMHNGYSNTTISRMELLAIIKCLKRIREKNIKVTIYSDSQYAVNCINKNWLVSWERNGWVGVKNSDLLRVYLKEYRKFLKRPKITHIKGHQNNNDIHSIGNNIADLLANYKQFKKRKKDLNK